jgi:hypothetical protein
MEYNFSDIEKILDFKSWSNKKKIDELFRIDCEMYVNMGTDSTVKERQETKRKSKAIYKTITKIDADEGKFLVTNIDC